MKYKPRVIVTDCTTAGTRQRLTTAHIETSWVSLAPAGGNSGSIFVGDETVSATNGYELKDSDFTGSDIVASNLTWNLPQGSSIDLSDIWVDTDNSGDDMIAIYLERVE